MSDLRFERRLTWRLRAAREHRDQRAFRLELSPTRTRFVAFDLSSADRWQHAWDELDLWLFPIDDEQVDPPVVTARYVGEVPRLLSAGWMSGPALLEAPERLGATDSIVPPEKPLAARAWRERRAFVQEWVGSDAIDDPESVVGVTKNRSTVAYALAYFTALEEKTNFSASESGAEQAEELLAVQELLRTRLRARWEARQDELLGRPGSAPVPDLTGVVIEQGLAAALSTLLLGLATDWFPEWRTSGSSDRDALRFAYENFAAGELSACNFTDAGWGGQPDSLNVLMFAEFGLMAIDMGVDVTDWESFVPLLVPIVILYEKAYEVGGIGCSPGSGKGSRYDDYSPPVEAGHVHDPNPAGLAALRSACEASLDVARQRLGKWLYEMTPDHGI